MSTRPFGAASPTPSDEADSFDSNHGVNNGSNNALRDSGEAHMAGREARAGTATNTATNDGDDGLWPTLTSCFSSDINDCCCPGQGTTESPKDEEAAVAGDRTARDKSLMDTTNDDQTSVASTPSQLASWMNMKERMVDDNGAVELDSSVHSTETVDVTTDKERRAIADQQNARKRRKLLLLMLVLVLLAFGIVMAVVFGVRRNDGGSRSSSAARAETTTATPPTPVSLLTQCAESTAIPSDSQEFFISGSTVTPNALFLDDAADVPVCGDVLVNGFGRWFTMIGDDQIYSASTCSGADADADASSDMDTQISVFTGTCTSLECVVANDNAPGCGDLSTASWFAAMGVEYHIYIHGYRGAQGTFTLSVSPISTDHEECAAASVLESPASSSTFGTTFGLALEAAQEQLGKTCSGGSSLIDEPGMWYQWQGTGETVTMSTCSERTDYPALISVLQGTSCQDLECINNQQRGPCERDDEQGEIVRFVSDASATYYVLIHKAIAADVSGNETFVGNYELSVQSETDFVDANFNAICADSQELVSDNAADESELVVVDNSTDAVVAAPDPFSATASGRLTRFAGIRDGSDISCGDADLESDKPQKWHRVIGTGSTMRASTCNDATDFDTQLTVLGVSGNDLELGCDNLQCIEGNDNDPVCGDKSTVTWLSLEGRPYYIVVHAFGSRSGSYTLTVEDIEQVDP